MSSRYGCDVCDQTTSRLFGMAAVVRLDETTTRFRTSVRGYCREHKDLILPAFVRDCLAEGVIEWQGEQPAELRPNDVEPFVQHMDHLALELGRELGLPGGAPTVTAQAVADGLTCPHCGAAVTLGDGPHVREAAERAGVSWECTGCRAAGILA